MEKFLSCDWGTSHFRLTCYARDQSEFSKDKKGLRRPKRESNDGIAGTYASFKQSRWEEKERRSFYLSIIQRHITAMSQELGSSLEGIPVVISGMISSSIGMVELPYKQVPFSAHGDDLLIYSIPPGQHFQHEVFIVSGAATASDVMRGEETKLIGCDGVSNASHQYYIFPGTHSKHVTVNNGSVVDFKTYMTGEFFALLSSKSILSGSVNSNDAFEANKKWFDKGVSDAVAGNILHQSFLIRTNDLFKKCSKEENYFYLSGLTIGTELKDLLQTEAEEIMLVCNEIFQPLYTAAYNVLGLSTPIHFQRDDEALLNGQFKLLARGNFRDLPA